MSTWVVYIVKCSDNTFYTGISNNLTQRIKQHNHSKEGARYTKSRRPVSLVYSENALDRSHASKREYEIKKMTRQQKQDLVNGC